MNYNISHRTTFEYEDSVSISQHVAHLRPRTFRRQHRHSYALSILPEPTTHTTARDYFGNLIEHIAIQKSHAKLIVEANSVVEIQPRTKPLMLAQSAAWNEIAATLAANKPKRLRTQEFCFDSPYARYDKQVQDFALSSFTPGRPVLEATMDLTARIFNEFEYQGGVSDISTPVSRVLEMRQGVCQDFAHLQIACLRSLGLPARYVSGYLLTHPPAGKEKLVGSDASHAWLAVWAGKHGWIQFDPTNGSIPDYEHIVVAWGRDYGDVSPISGFIVGGGAHELKVAVDVRATDFSDNSTLSPELTSE